MKNNTWWKWGNPNESQHLSDYPKFISFLQQQWGTEIKDDFKIPEEFDVPEPTFQEQDFSAVFSKLQKRQFTNTKSDRLRYAIARSYHDIIKVFSNQILTYPDFIIYPESEEDIIHILDKANQKNIKIITYSGGSNVTGATEVEADNQLTMVLNMTRLKSLIDIDGDANTATFQAGIYGPELEEILNGKGYTLRTFPTIF